MKKWLTIVFLTLVLLNLSAQSDESFRIENYNLGDGNLAIDGYDPVAYFIEEKAVEGSDEFAFVYKGILYHFYSAENRDKFKAAPERYEPEYGGWCAYQMGREGEKVSINPESFELKDGRLYLFYDKFFVNTKTKWLKNRQELNQK
ncbi:MAG: YHS domain-containing (seleno)protein, partial [Owenweeksia sp.]